MSPSRRLALLQSLNALIRLAYNAGALDQHAAALSSPGPHPVSPLPRLTSTSPPSHPFFASDRDFQISALRNDILSLLSESQPEGDSSPPSPETPHA